MLEKNVTRTGAFVAESLKSHTEVDQVHLLVPQVLQIFRKKDPSFLAGTIASERVERSTVKHLLTGEFEIEFIANVPRESFWTGAAIDFVSNRSVAFGGIRDLFSAIALTNVREYVRKEFSFVERGLRQHDRVRELKRLHDRLYIVKRHDLADVKVVQLNEYELAADHVRTAGDRYGRFSDIVITNPYGKATSNARQAAESMGAEIHKWGEFLARLNKR